MIRRHCLVMLSFLLFVQSCALPAFGNDERPSSGDLSGRDKWENTYQVGLWTRLGGDDMARGDEDDTGLGTFEFTRLYRKSEVLAFGAGGRWEIDPFGSRLGIEGVLKGALGNHSRRYFRAAAGVLSFGGDNLDRHWCGYFSEVEFGIDSICSLALGLEHLKGTEYLDDPDGGGRIASERTWTQVLGGVKASSWTGAAVTCVLMAIFVVEIKQGFDD